jgi:hypothetical protein
MIQVDWDADNLLAIGVLLVADFEDDAQQFINGLFRSGQRYKIGADV